MRERTTTVRWRSWRRWAGFGLLALLAFLPFGIALAPLGWVMPEPGEQNPFTFCLFTNLTGYHCPGCGMTRAVFCFLHGRFADAWEANRLVVVVFPLLAWLWGGWLVRLGRKLFGSSRRRGAPSASSGGANETDTTLASGGENE